MFKLFLCFLSYFVTVSFGHKVPFLTFCKIDDNACILSSARAALPHLALGLPDLGIPPIDPLILDDAKFNEGGLNVQFKDFKVHGPGKCQITKMNMKADKTTLEFDMHCPITAIGQYEADGKLLFVPIEGKGEIEVKTEKILISVIARMSVVDGHWHVDSTEHSYEPEEQIFFRLDNLFGGDEEKSKPVVDILNGSWKQVICTIGKPIVQEIVHTAKDHINKFLALLLAEEMFLA